MNHILTKLGCLVVNWAGNYDDEFMAGLAADGVNYDSGKVGVTILGHKIKSWWTYITGDKMILITLLGCNNSNKGLWYRSYEISGPISH